MLMLTEMGKSCVLSGCYVTKTLMILRHDEFHAVFFSVLFAFLYDPDYDNGI